MTDVWADADKQNQDSRQGAYAAPAAGPSRLFGAEGGAPSLFNKSHPVGTERTGIITKKPYDQQRTKMGSGEPLFWQPGNKLGTDAVNATTGQPNRPVLDTVIEVETDYAMDAQEAGLLNRDESYEGGDRRIFVGKEIKAFKDAIKDAVQRGVQLTSDADMVGKRITQKRVSTKPNPHGGDPIKVHTYRIDNA